ncbi:MAG: hypothetical protein RIB67_01445 [Miltoncostaeaceae bacterium]
MSTAADRPTRVAADLLDSAIVEGARESRSAKQQIDHWARVGRAVCAQQTAARRRVEEALSGDLPLAELSEEEATTFNAEVQARIEESLRATSLGAVLNAAGVATVSLSDSGELMEHRPDGTSGPLASA